MSFGRPTQKPRTKRNSTSEPTRIRMGVSDCICISFDGDDSAPSEKTQGKPLMLVRVVQTVLSTIVIAWIFKEIGVERDLQARKVQPDSRMMCSSPQRRTRKKRLQHQRTGPTPNHIAPPCIASLHTSHTKYQRETSHTRHTHFTHTSDTHATHTTHSRRGAAHARAIQAMHTGHTHRAHTQAVTVQCVLTSGNVTLKLWRTYCLCEHG